MNKLTQDKAFKKGTDHQFIKPISLGPWTSFSLLNDPKHMCFVLSRYKFCAKILEGKKRILEIGCGDAFGTPIVAQDADYLLAIDSDVRLIEGNKKRLKDLNKIAFQNLNICEVVPIPYGVFPFDGIFSIDVIEHLDPCLEESFMKNSCRFLKKNGICIIGTPNITARKWATPRSSVQHINLKGLPGLRKLLHQYFQNVLIFSMNDEMVHTGYGPMAHYLFGVGIGLK